MCFMRSSATGLVIILLLLIGCRSQRSLPASDLANKKIVKIPVKKILIVGTGSISSRLFLDNLSDHIINLLNKKGVQGNFSFQENAKAELKFNVDISDSLEYNAFLIFQPMNKADFTMNKPNKIPIPLLGNAEVYGLTANTYKQQFLIQTFVKSNKRTPIWEATLNASFDLTEKETYKQYSTDIVNILSTNFFAF
jgi:hypothetical protein